MPKHFFTHAASLDQGFPHCPIFPTAASRRSLGRVSVPMWPVTLSGRLLIVGLVGRYLTNYLIRRGSISYHRSFSHRTMRHCALMRYSLDLHVLSTPPAFILSQDRTLKFKQIVFKAVSDFHKIPLKASFHKGFRVNQ